MTAMTIARAIALVYLGPCKGWDGKDVNVVEDLVICTSPSVHIAADISTA